MRGCFKAACSLVVGSLFVRDAMAQSPDIILDRLMKNVKFKEAQQYIVAHHSEMLRVSGSPEAQLKSAGLADIRVDQWGNVSAIREENSGRCVCRDCFTRRANRCAPGRRNCEGTRRCRDIHKMESVVLHDHAGYRAR